MKVLKERKLLLLKELIQLKEQQHQIRKVELQQLGLIKELILLVLQEHYALDVVHLVKGVQDALENVKVDV